MLPGGRSPRVHGAAGGRVGSRHALDITPIQKFFVAAFTLWAVCSSLMDCLPWRQQAYCRKSSS